MTGGEYGTMKEEEEEVINRLPHLGVNSASLFGEVRDILGLMRSIVLESACIHR